MTINGGGGIRKRGFRGYTEISSAEQSSFTQSAMLKP